jgi:hypothetical protein
VTRNCDTQSAADRPGRAMGAVVLGNVSPSVTTYGNSESASPMNSGGS